MQHGRDDQGVRAQVGVGRHHVHGHAQPMKGAIVGQPERGVLEPGGIGLQAHGPAVVVGQDDGDGLGRQGALEPIAQGADLGTHRSDLLIAAAGLSVVIEDAVPPLLDAGAAGAPAKVDDAIGAMGHGLVRPEAQLPRLGGRAHGLPAGWAGLLLHHPEGLVSQAPHQGVGCGDGGGILLDKGGIVVPGDEIELAAHGEIVDLAKAEAHQVGGDGGRAVGLEDVDLFLGIADPLIGGKAVEIQLQARVGGAHGIGGQGDLIPGGIGVAPEGGAPGVVEGVQRAIAALQPALEGLGAGGAVAAGMMAAEFVVELPSHHLGMPGIALGHGRGDLARELAVARAGGAVLPPHAELDPAAVALHQ